MKNFFILFFVSWVSVAFSQNEGFVWAKRWGSTGADGSFAVAVDSFGNTYTTGPFQGTVDFDPSPTSTFNLTASGGVDIFITKLDVLGNFVWAKRVGGIDMDYSSSIAVDIAGNVYTTGYFGSTADFDPSANTFNLSSVGNSDIFVSKLDASGNFVWAKQFGGVGEDFANYLALDRANNVYITGVFMGSADFDPSSNVFNLVSAGRNDIFINKLDAIGNFIWAKRFGGINDDVGYGLTTDPLGNVYTTGYFEGKVDFDPNADTSHLTSMGGYDIFISKLSAAGNFIWAKRLGGANYEDGNAITIDNSGNIYVVGRFGGTADFDPSSNTFNLTSNGIFDMFICKLNNVGDFVWAKSMGGVGNDVLFSVALDALNNVYATGAFQSLVDFDPSFGTFNLTSLGNFDAITTKFDTLGNFIWAKRIGGAADDLGIAIVVDRFGDIYTVGNFAGSADFDPGANAFNLASAGNTDAFISKLGRTVATHQIYENLNVTLFPNPVNHFLIVEILLEEKNNIEFAIMNELGQVMQVIQKKNLESGKHQFKIATNALASGIYFYTLKCEDKISSGKILIQH